MAVYSRGQKGLQGATGVQGPTGVVVGLVTTATTTWLGPTGADVKSFLVSSITTLSPFAPTSPIFYYTVQPNTVTDVSVTVLGTNGQGASGTYKQDLNATYGLTGIVGTGAAVMVGNAVTTNQRYPLGASGWNGALGATGPSVSLTVSTPTGAIAGATGTVSWNALIQVQELPFI